MTTYLGEFWAVALPIIGIALAVLALVFTLCCAAYRWQCVVEAVRKLYRFVCRRPHYDYHRIFASYTERFNAIRDRRKLYDEILDLSMRVVGADGASLLVKDAKGSFVVKASRGVKPFTFDVTEVQHFLDWFDLNRTLVTRRYLLNSKKCRDIKIEGLRYCVQFNAETCIPLFVEGRLFALLNLGARTSASYDRETRSLLSLMATQFATTIHNAHLYGELTKQSAKLQQASAFKNQLLSNLSHELRTPLNSIIGLSELIAEGGDGAVNQEQVTHLSMIRQSGMRLLDTVSAMLDISKIESNRLELNVRHLSVGRLVTDAAEKVKLSRETMLEVDLKDGVPGVYGDESHLRHVLRHLLDNAAKFTKRGKITINATKAGEMLRVCVKDTGVGIRKESRKHLFEGFYQEDGSHTREHEGLGLGLFISRKIIECHGGRMWMKSKLGRGSEFYFTLPLKPTGIPSNEVV